MFSLQFSEKLDYFASSFGISSGSKKLVQGMWLVDHGELEDSLTFLLLAPPLPNSFHTRIIKAFLFQEKPKLALRLVFSNSEANIVDLFLKI